MNNPWTPEIDLTPEEAGALIIKQFPELAPIKITLLGKGFDNTVFQVNQKYVFRFPRRTVAVELLGTENHLLPQLAPILNISIPVPIFFVQPSADYQWPFSGYQIVSGETPGILTEADRNVSALPLAHFLQKLHQYPAEQAKNYGVPFDQLSRLNIANRKQRLKENVKQAIADDLILNVDKVIKYLANLRHVEESGDLVLVHGDLHFKNILVNSTGLVSGIIDWGDTHIGSRAVDLAFVYSYLPAEGRRQFYKIYGEVDDKTKYLARFKAIYTSVLLLRYAHEQNVKEFVEAAKQSLNLALID